MKTFINLRYTALAFLIAGADIGYAQNQCEFLYACFHNAAPCQQTKRPFETWYFTSPISRVVSRCTGPNGRSFTQTNIGHIPYLPNQINPDGYAEIYGNTMSECQESLRNYQARHNCNLYRH
jgi:hypothetical protein